MSESCRTCGKTCENFTELAQHIIEERETHRKGYKWASSFLLKVNFLNQKKDPPQGRIPLDEQEKQNKIDAQREISGITRKQICACPNCRQTFTEKLPVEFAQSPMAWRSNNALMVNCGSCKSVRRKLW